MNAEYKFKFGDIVLMRRKNLNGVWDALYYSRESADMVYTIGLCGYDKVHHEFIPYKGNEHLLGTVDSPKPKWTPRCGELVAVTDNRDLDWYCYKFIEMEADGGKYMCIPPDTATHTFMVDWKYCEPLKDHFDIG